MRSEFQRDIYDSLDEFIKEYSSRYNEEGENSMGMDFSYKKEKYRLCREYDDVFYLYKVIHDGKNDEFIELVVCNSMEELLITKVVNNIEFKKIIMDEQNTIIYGKD